jgi:hypothetical protein
MKQFILVAGVDYERKGVDFRLFCNSRIKRIIAANKAREDLTFQVFDVRAGEVVTHTITYPSGKRTETVAKGAPFAPVTRANYDRIGSGADAHYHFKDGQTGMISVTDVYAAVRAIGSSAAGTLLELSFFSHAWHGGPILVNSHDDGFAAGPPAIPGGPPTALPIGGARDPDDKDPRGHKDFTPPNMSAAQVAEFQAAYHPDAYSWSWGCAFPRVIHEILHKLERHRDYRQTGLADATVFVFDNFRADHILRLESVLGMLFLDPRRVELEFKELKRYFCLETEASYTHMLAVNSKRKAFGGVMGTYSEYDTGRLPLMHVHGGFARHLQFYKNYLGFAFDPERRGYGEFKPAFSC